MKNKNIIPKNVDEYMLKFPEDVAQKLYSNSTIPD